MQRVGPRPSYFSIHLSLSSHSKNALSSWGEKGRTLAASSSTFLLIDVSPGQHSRDLRPASARPKVGHLGPRPVLALLAHTRCHRHHANHSRDRRDRRGLQADYGDRPLLLITQIFHTRKAMRIPFVRCIANTIRFATNGN